MKLFYNSFYNCIVESERFDGEYSLSFNYGVVLVVREYKTIREAEADGWTYLGAL